MAVDALTQQNNKSETMSQETQSLLSKAWLAMAARIDIDNMGFSTSFKSEIQNCILQAESTSNLSVHMAGNLMV